MHARKNRTYQTLMVADRNMTRLPRRTIFPEERLHFCSFCFKK